MKRKYLLVCVLVIGAGGFGCSNPAEKSKKSSSANSNSTVATSTNQTVNSNPPDSNAVVAPTEGSLRERANRKRRVDTDPSATPVPPNFSKAPEDSRAAVMMTEDGSVLEIRIFTSHPQLAKVEATRLGVKDKALKVYLRNGQTLEVKTDRISNLAVATTTEILEIAGIKGRQKSTDRPRLAGQK